MSWRLVGGSAGLGACLVASSPGRPSESVGRVVYGLDGQGGEQAADLVAGQPDQPGWCWVVGVFGGADDGEEGVGNHGQGDPAAPGGVVADLVLIQPGQALAGLEGFLDPPAGSGHPD